MNCFLDQVNVGLSRQLMANADENMGSTFMASRCHKVFYNKLKLLQANTLAFKTCWIFSSWIASFNKYSQTGFKNMAELFRIKLPQLPKRKQHGITISDDPA